MSSFDRVGSLRLDYVPESAEKASLLREISTDTGIDAIVRILSMKRYKQTELIDKHIFALVAGTGAGKTTTMVYRLFEKIVTKKAGARTLLCTQPRVNLAMTQPFNVARLFPNVKVGEELGYITGSGKIVARAEKSIVYCTTRILDNLMLNRNPKKFGLAFPIIVIDEVHDQSIEMLMTLQNVREYLAMNYKEPWCPTFIVTSATIDPLQYIAYFDADQASPYNTAFIAGNTPFPITERYLDKEVVAKHASMAVPIAVEEVGHLIESIIGDGSDKTNPDILVFWTSIKEIKTFLSKTRESIASEEPKDDLSISITRGSHKWRIFFLSCTRLDVEGKTASYQTIYRPRNPFEMRIIGATNTLEAGATLVSLAVSMDCARQNTRIIYPLQGKDQMVAMPISESSRIQRRGRVGRVAPGTYFGLYVEETLQKIRPSPPPSTLVGANVPSSIYTIIVEKTFRRYKEVIGDVSAIAKLICLKRFGYKLPTTDICRDIQLLLPISMDSAIHMIAKLRDIGMIDWDGSLTLTGLQAAVYRNMPIGEVFIRARLMREAVHPFDISLFCSIIAESIARAELTNIVEWKNTISRFYPGASFGFKDKPPRRSDVIEVIQLVMKVFDMYSDKTYKPPKAGPYYDQEALHSTVTDLLHRNTLPEVYRHSLWGRFDVGEAKVAINKAIESYEARELDGAFYRELYVDSNEKEKLIAVFTGALAELQDRITGRRTMMESEDRVLSFF